MTDTEYVPPKEGWVAEQLEKIDAAGDTRAADIDGMSIVVFTVKGAKSGKLRRVPLMRVEHDGSYAAVATAGGSPKHPAWYHSFVANPEIEVQDGTENRPLIARLTDGAEREVWWERAVAAFPPYAEYVEKTERQIPVFVCEPRG